jgi:hypothetical protein
MKRILKFSTFESERSLPLNQEQLYFLNNYAEDWKINPSTGKIDAHIVKVKSEPVKIPEGLYFGKIELYFDLSNCDISSWEGFPDELEFGSLIVSKNNFSGFDGCPSKIGGSLRIWANRNLTTLVGCPTEIGEDLDVSYCSLKNLVGSPPVINGNFSCEDNPLESLEGAPEIIMGKFDCVDFKIEEGDWGLEGFTKVLSQKNLSKRGFDLLMTLMTPEFIQKEFDSNPGPTTIRMSRISNLEPIEKILSGIRFPDEFKDDWNLLSGLQDLGI